MNEEPGFICQTGECSNATEAQAWTRERMAEARAEGFNFFRVSWRNKPPLYLVEGWIKAPTDQGAPRFQLTSVEYSDAAPPRPSQEPDHGE